MIECPAARIRPSAAALEDLAEQSLAGTARQEHVLSRCVVIAVAGGDHDALDAERHCLIEEIRHVVRILATGTACS